MYKVLLVDDEEWVIHSLKSSIDWEAYGFELAGDARSADEALSMIEANRPQLVFTDIKMPGMSGLELIKRASALAAGIQFVVASGHAEFVYAQKAIQYGAIGYCLKPFEESELRDCLLKAKRKLESGERRETPELIDAIYGETEEELAVVAACLRQEGVDPERELAVFEVIGPVASPLPPYPYAALKTGPSKMVFLVNGQHANAFQARLAMNPNAAIGCAEPIFRLQEVKAALKAANLAAFHFFIAGAKGCYSATPPSTERKLPVGRIAEAVASQDLKRVDAAFEELAHFLQAQSATIKDAYTAYAQIVYIAGDRLGLHLDYEIDHYEQLPSLFPNVSDMLSVLCRQIKQHMTAMPTSDYADIGHQTIREIVKYVAENFYRDVNVGEISKRFYVTPNYVSHLFKKEMGVNFTEYIAKLRIDYATSLLRQPELAIQEISEKCGFNDYFYFTKIFKKLTGLTPSEYRKRSQ